MRFGAFCPTLQLTSVEDLGPEQMRTQELLSIARTWQEFGLKPDFESDWTPNTLFQYVGEDGEIAALKKTETGATLVLPEESLGYERVFGATQVKTHRNIPHWRAYNETAILGLHPEKSYFLSEYTARFLSSAYQRLARWCFCDGITCDRKCRAISTRKAGCLSRN